MTNFLSDLNKAKVAEQRLAAFFMTLCTGFGLFFSEGLAAPYYDFGFHLPGNKRVLVECKVDSKANLTGNLFVETENTRQGSESGVRLAAKVATRMVYLIPQTETVYSFDPRALISWMATDCPDCRAATLTNSKGILVPLEKLKKQPFVKEFTLS